ncbi:membrane dipeptidase [Haliea sp. E1-2-M8]|uniref:membrane dipeptidase n=1 Tax=Haliea sp. E1-2-M8 TaxID=3064706 RepID=UPI002724BB33|nr:membrane dipeptidase [Haliea sp. E1-2-M8]MDO8863191.1 membrane dipeptidase [Haliea sp. E1-2-M8]
MMKPQQKRYNRRSLLRAGGAAVVTLPMLNFGAYRVFAGSDTRYSSRAVDLVNGTQVFDMLSTPFPFGPMMLAAFSDHPKRQDGFAISEEYLQTVLSSGIDVLHPAIGLSADEVAPYIARVNALVAEHPQHLRRIDAIADLQTLKKGERVGFIVGVQNSDHFREVNDVDLYYHLGQRVGQLTYNSRNLIGTGATDRSDGGLSDFGVQVVERMNALGMAVDVSHCGDQTTLDAFELSAKPVLITHSNVRSLAGGHVRCKPDSAIEAMGRAGSVMGITGVRNFIRDREPTNIEHMVDHIDYVAKLVGIEHVGVGSDMDMDGYDDIPEPASSKLKAGYKASYAFRDKLDVDDFDHPRRTFDLVEALIRRGYTDQHIELVLGGNFRRVLGEIWQG